MFRTFENVGRSLVNGNGPRQCRGIRGLAGMQGKGIKIQLGFGHDDSPLFPPKFGSNMLHFTQEK
jgi:hypothetical protein